MFLFFFFRWSGDHRDLHSFPTRRSSDLRLGQRGAVVDAPQHRPQAFVCEAVVEEAVERAKDRKSTRLNSSHVEISYAVFCLKKKKHTTQVTKLTVSDHFDTSNPLPHHHH